MFADKKCQATKYYKEINKNCQTNGIMWEVKHQMDVQSEESVKQSSFKKKHVPLYKDKKCKATICENIDSKSQISRNSDKKCQENENNVMWSVTRKTDVQLLKQASRRLCSDKNCPSTRHYTNMTKTVNYKE